MISTDEPSLKRSRFSTQREGEDIINNESEVFFDAVTLSPRESLASFSKNYYTLNPLCSAIPPRGPTKPDVNIRWTERVGTYHLPAASFTYEATYSGSPSSLDDLGFAIQWQVLPYSLKSQSRFITYCVVQSVSEELFCSPNIISKGDIVLRINGEMNFIQPGDNTSITTLNEKFNKIELDEAGSFVIKFLRVGSRSTNMALSAAELILFAKEKHLSAKFNVKKVIVDEKSKLQFESSAFDYQSPTGVKKMMQGSKVAWQLIPTLPAGAAQAKYSINLSNTYAAMINTTAASVSTLSSGQQWGLTSPFANVHNISEEEEAVFSTFSEEGGLFKDRNKFVVIYVDSTARPIVTNNSLDYKMYNLGAYDTEEEAMDVFYRARECKELCGSFVPRVFLNNNFTSAKVAGQEDEDESNQGTNDQGGTSGVDYLEE